MNFLVFLLFGLIAGAIAKALLPGRMGGGWLGALICGVLGSWLGGFLAGMFFGGNPMDAGLLTNPMAWVFAIIGSILVLLIFSFIKKAR